MSAPKKPQDRTDVRWWKLYQQERLKLGRKWGDRLTDAETVRAAREATRRFQEDE